jgi:hypothetical protein
MSYQVPVIATRLRRRWGALRTSATNLTFRVDAHPWMRSALPARSC